MSTFKHVSVEKILCLALLFVSALAAQNTAVYPTALPTDTDLLIGANRAQSTLSSGISAADLAIPVTSAATFKAPSTVTIDSEIIKICSIVGNTLNVCASGRGFDTTHGGGAAASHPLGATVRATITAWYHNQAAAEIKALATALGTNLANVQTVAAKDQASGYAGLTPGTKLNAAQGQEVWSLADLSDATGKQGNASIVQMFGGGTPATNDCAKFDANGNVISAGVACGTGGGSPVVAPPAASSWTGVNAGTSTVTDVQGGVLFNFQVGATLRLFTVPVPGPTFTLTAKFIGHNATGNGRYGIVLYNSGNSKITQFGPRIDSANGVVIEPWTMTSTWANYDVAANRASVPWYRIVVTATDILFYISFEGNDWILIVSWPISTWMSAITDIGVVNYNDGGGNPSILLTSWSAN